MKTGLVLVALTTLVSGLTCGAEPRSCTVNGHGPYDETLESCTQLAKDQARADCNTSLRNATAKFVYKADGNAQHGSCVSQRTRAICAPAHCKP